MLPRNHYSPGYEGYLLPSSSVVISVAANSSDPSRSLEWSLLTTSPSGKTIKYTISPSVYSAVQPRPPYASTTYHVPGDNNAPLLSGPDPLCTLASFVLAGVSSDALSSETLTALSEEAAARCHAGVPLYLIPDYVAGRVSAPFVWLLLMLDGIEKHLSRAAQTQAQEEHSGERAALRALNVLVCDAHCYRKQSLEPHSGIPPL
ncbi:hypothetical protein OF83DRAFT_634820 [Amylostereum chailletii]|nr:hypothetical protein OF83DRAFT_634820 [Amylostereum chailletii]